MRYPNICYALSFSIVMNSLLTTVVYEFDVEMTDCQSCWNVLDDCYYCCWYYYYWYELDDCWDKCWEGCYYILLFVPDGLLKGWVFFCYYCCYNSEDLWFPDCDCLLLPIALARLLLETALVGFAALEPFPCPFYFLLKIIMLLTVLRIPLRYEHT